ncbi:YetF domain-containing protein [Anaerophilus nitritogenes]|uniref:YetF domain-containing protein n=1 Tax=Anaerophilus nitritogenes TaxID=2498136 RepID=UPI0013EA95FD|nr:DUF421 domain-containing protein [Anaerophilus nitritogenes]
MDLYIIIFFRIVSIMLLLLFSTLFIMGKRPIGELPVFDFLSIIVIGAIVGADIADPEIKHLPTAFSVIILSIFQRLIGFWMTKSNRVRKTITFEPTIIIKNSKFIYSNIKKINYTIHDILMLLREKDIFDINKVDYGIIESNGNLSILKKPEYENITIKDMNKVIPESNIYFSIIIDGKLQKDKIEKLGFSEEGIENKLKQQGISSYSEIFYASINKKGEMSISTYHEY